MKSNGLKSNGMEWDGMSHNVLLREALTLQCDVAGSDGARGKGRDSDPYVPMTVGTNRGANE